jgi:hypothetical protein
MIGQTIWAAGDKLRYSPESAVTPEGLGTLRRLKPHLLPVVSLFGPCDPVEVLPRQVADVRWKMLRDACNERVERTA